MTPPEEAGLNRREISKARRLCRAESPGPTRGPGLGPARGQDLISRGALGPELRINHLALRADQNQDRGLARLLSL